MLPKISHREYEKCLPKQNFTPDKKKKTAWMKTMYVSLKYIKITSVLPVRNST